MLTKRQWIDRAVNYMLNLKLFNGTLDSEVDDAYELAESLWESSKNKDETNDSCPIEQVDEDLYFKDVLLWAEFMLENEDIMKDFQDFLEDYE